MIFSGGVTHGTHGIHGKPPQQFPFTCPFRVFRVFRGQKEIQRPTLRLSPRDRAGDRHAHQSRRRPRPGRAAGESAVSGLSASAPARSGATGWVVMVPFTLPGERVACASIATTRISPRPTWSRCSRLRRTASRRPVRSSAAAAAASTSTSTYAEQLKWKRQQVDEAPEIHGRRRVPRVAGHRFAAGVRLPLEDHAALSTRRVGEQTTAGRDRGPHRPTNDLPIGFLKQGTRFDLVDVPQCPIATPEINAKLPEVRAKTQATSRRRRVQARRHAAAPPRAGRRRHRLRRRDSRAGRRA